MNRQNATPWWVWLVPLPLVWWASAGLAMRWDAAAGLAGILTAVNDFLAQPFPVYYTPQTPRFLLLGTALYAVVAIVVTADHKNTRPGEEHGSARWGNVFALNRKYVDKAGPNLLLTRHFRIGVDGYKHKHNTNILVVGGSGAGKTRTYAVPNVLEAARTGPGGKGCSLVITDPKGEILRKTGRYLLKQGYEVRVFDLIDPNASYCYNPFVYVQDDKDVLQLITNLIQNTTPSHAKSSDPFWEKSETARHHGECQQHCQNPPCVLPFFLFHALSSFSLSLICTFLRCLNYNNHTKRSKFLHLSFFYFSILFNIPSFITAKTSQFPLFIVIFTKKISIQSARTR